MSDAPASGPGAPPRDAPRSETGADRPDTTAARYLDQWENHLSLLATAGPSPTVRGA